MSKKYVELNLKVWTTKNSVKKIGKNIRYLSNSSMGLQEFRLLAKIFHSSDIILRPSILPINILKKY